MATLNQHIKKAESLTPQKIEDALFNFLKSINAELADKNVDQIYTFGQDILGKVIGTYSRTTEKMTGGRKREGQRFNLKETGEFLEGLYAQVSNNEVFFNTPDSKKEEVLNNLWSKNIFGLDDENLRAVIQNDIQPFLKTFFTSNLA